MPDATGDSASFVTDQWRTTSLAAPWTHPGDWHAIAASALVIAALSGGSADEAATALGAERAAQGVGLVEALADLAVLFEIVNHAQPPFSVTTSFANSWAEETTAALLTAHTIDPLSGMTTREYLVPRLRELYAEAAARGIRPDDERCLIIIDLPDGAASGWRRAVREAGVGRVLSTVLDRGQTNSILASGTFVSLVPRDDSLDEIIVRIRRALSRDEAEDAPQPIVRINALPATVAEAEKLLLFL